VILADVRQADEAELAATRNRKRASKPAAVELLVVLLAGDLPPTNVSTSHDFRCSPPGP
jgi:hypothetical protein